MEIHTIIYIVFIAYVLSILPGMLQFRGKVKAAYKRKYNKDMPWYMIRNEMFIAVFRNRYDDDPEIRQMSKQKKREWIILMVLIVLVIISRISLI